MGHYNRKTCCFIDPLGQPTVTAGRDHCFCTCRTYVRPTFQNIAIQNKANTMFATGETVSLAEWIIDDTCLVLCSIGHASQFHSCSRSVQIVIFFEQDGKTD